jgi:hypothetical protein
MGLDATLTIGGKDELLDATIESLGLATFDVVTFRTSDTTYRLALTGEGQ